MSTPPLPPGFVLDDAQPAPGMSASAMPPLPPGFELEQSDALAHAQAAPITDIPGVQATFGDVETGSSSYQEPRSFADIAQAGANELGRSFGLGGRAVLEGIGSTIGIVSDPFTYGLDEIRNAISPPQQTVSGLVSGQKPAPVRTAGAREAAGNIADRLGLPRPETATERVAGNVTEAVAGGGGIIKAARTVANRAPGLVRAIGEGFASQPATQLAGAAGGSGAAGVTRESGGSPTAQVVAGLAGGLTPAAVKTVGSEAIRRTVRGSDPAQMKRTIEDFRKVGATPSVGQASGNRIVQGAESLLAGGPTSAGVMGRAAEQQAENIGAGLRQAADDFIPNASSEKAGRAIEKGVEQFASNVRATRNALYWDADRRIPDTTRLPLANTQQALTRLTALTPGAESTTAALVNPKIATLAENIRTDLMAAQATGSGGLPYSAVKDIRSRIGEELSDFSLSTDKPTAQYKALYAALSQDLDQAAKQLGPEAARAAKRASNYFKASADRLSQVERVVDKNGGPEKVFNAVMSGTQDGGTTLRAVMQSLPKEGQQALTGAVIKRMGLATPGQQGAEGAEFSAQTFLTNWNKVSPEAKRALFDRHGPKFTADMDRVARVAQNIKEGSRVFANPSGTANRIAAGTYLLSLAGSIATGQLGTAATLAAGGAAANALARGLTNPRFVSWLAKSTELPISAVPQQINVLKALAASEGDQELADLATQLEQAQNQPNDAANR